MFEEISNSTGMIGSSSQAFTPSWVRPLILLREATRLLVVLAPVFAKAAGRSAPVIVWFEPEMDVEFNPPETAMPTKAWLGAARARPDKATRILRFMKVLLVERKSEQRYIWWHSDRCVCRHVGTNAMK